MLDKFAKKESPILGYAGFGGGVSALLTLASGKITYVDDVFATHLYTSTGNNLTITNGVDLAGEGGLIWTKWRSGGDYSSESNALLDTERGFEKLLQSDTSGMQSGVSSYFTAASDGYQITTSSSLINHTSGGEYCSWTFRKCPGFFDVVTWTGDGVNGRQISHNLRSTPGAILIKRTGGGGTENWAVYHRSSGTSKSLALNLSVGEINTSYITAVSSTTFSVSNQFQTNGNDSSATYVAYVFAHNDGSFGEDSDEAVIKCDSYTGTGSSGKTVDLGFEPQWVLIKKATATGNNRAWWLGDIMRGMPAGSGDQFLFPNTDATESGSWDFIDPTPTGFTLTTGDDNFNTSGVKYNYIAIRRPHKPPEAGTDVFAVQATRGATNGTPSQLLFTAGFPVDLMMQLAIGGGSSTALTVDRLRGEQFSRTNSNAAEIGNDGYLLAGSMEGVYGGSSQSADSNYSAIMFRRAPGFFDIVTYNGSNSAQNITHNLGAKPALIICKRRNSTGNWQVYADVPAGGATKYMMLDDTGYFNANSNRWNNTEPTATQFTLGTYSDLNTSGGTYVAYLFGNLDGICKIGQYTGTGNDITIDCGFNPRFIMIKVCTNSGDGWYVFDSARGINTGNDPWTRFNQSGQQITNTDIVDPTSGGFIVQAGAGSRANDADGRKYLYWAIA